MNNMRFLAVLLTVCVLCLIITINNNITHKDDCVTEMVKSGVPAIEARFAVKGMGHVQENSFFLLKMSEQK